MNTIGIIGRLVKFAVVALVVLLKSISASAQLTITTSPALTAHDLAQSLAGPGIVVTNAQLSFGYAHQSVGLFSNGQNTNLGLSNGVVLSTGYVADINQPAKEHSSSVTSGANIGNVFLEELIEPALKTHDAVMLEFDVQVSTDIMQFEYVFASEEYPDFSCSEYNDVFGFFISGPGITGNIASMPGIRNIALLPDGVTPVTINNVHAATSICSAVNVQYFVNNEHGTSIIYNGFTTVLTARVVGLIPFQTYKLRLAIADVEDEQYDSGVFIKQGSLTSCEFAKIDAGPDKIMCPGTSFVTLNATEGSTHSDIVYKWTPAESTDNPTGLITNVAPEITTKYYLEASVNGCKTRDSVTVTVVPPMELAITANPPGGFAPLLIHFTPVGNDLATYNWWFGDPVGEGSSTVSHPEYLYQQAGLYSCTLVATDNFGCVDSATYATIRVSLDVPNIITPNADGRNDVFDIGLTPAGTSLHIFNRWGKSVYKADNYDNTWSGSELADGIYYYLINFPDSGEEYKGWVEIHR